MGSGPRVPGRRVGRSRGSAARCRAVESCLEAVRSGTGPIRDRSSQRSRVQVEPVGQVAEVLGVPVATSARISRRPFGQRSAGCPQAASRVVQAAAVRFAAGESWRERLRSGRSGSRRQQGRSRPGAEVQPGPRSSGAARAASAQSWVSGQGLGRGGRRPSRSAQVAVVPAGGESVASDGDGAEAGCVVGRGSRPAEVGWVAEVGRGRRSRRSGPGSRAGRKWAPGPGQGSRGWAEGGMGASWPGGEPGSRGIGVRPCAWVHPGRCGRGGGVYSRGCVSCGCVWVWCACPYTYVCWFRSSCYSASI